MSPSCTMQELLTVDFLAQARIIAGWSGRWHKVGRIVNGECLDPSAPISDSLIFLIDEKSQAELEKKLLNEDQQIPAGILMGGCDPNVSPQMLAWAEKTAVPLVFTRQNFTQDELQQVFSLALSLVASGRFLSLLEAFRLRQWDDFQLDLAEFMNQLTVYLQNPTVFVDPAFQPLQTGSSLLFVEETELTALLSAVRRQNLWRKPYKLKGIGNATEQVLTLAEGRLVPCYVVPLSESGRELGYLVAFGIQQELNSLDLWRLRESALFCRQVLCIQKNKEEVEKKYQENFLYDLLYNNFESEQAFLKRARFWGWDFNKPHDLLLIEADNFEQLRHKEKVMETLQLTVEADLRPHYHYVIVSQMQDQLVAIMPGDPSKIKQGKQHLKATAASLQRNLAKIFTAVTFSIGIGKCYATGIDLCRSYQEAKLALSLGRFIQERQHITHFEDLGVIRLLSYISLEQLDDYCQEYLAPLIRYDEENETQYLEIIQTYFQQNGDLNSVAKKMFMHPNTVRHRLKKIEEILDLDLQMMEDRMSLAIACKIIKMCKNNC